MQFLQDGIFNGLDLLFWGFVPMVALIHLTLKQERETENERRQ